jgi:hypothetical protein
MVTGGCKADERLRSSAHPEKCTKVRARFFFDAAMLMLKKYMMRVVSDVLQASQSEPAHWRHCGHECEASSDGVQL